MVLLTNFVPPYRIPVFLELQRRVRQFRVLISTPMEADRPWSAQTGGVDVVTQHSFTWEKKFNPPWGFSEPNYIHFPYDTLFQLIRYRPDVAISGEFGFRTFSAAIYRLLFRRSRLIVWATLSEDTERYRSWLRVAIRSVITRFADAIITNGKSGIRYLEQFQIAREKLFVVPYTTDSKAFTVDGPHREGRVAYRMLYSGRLVQRKQLVAFVEVLEDWCLENPTRQVEFWFVGDGPERERLENRRSVPNLALTFLGSVSYADLPAIYQQCGAMVIPTLADEWALVVNEGLAAGMPVLGSIYSQAVQELVVDSENGWAFRADQPGEVRSAVSRFLSTDETTLNHMREKAQAAVAELTPEWAASKILSVVEFVRGGGRALVRLLPLVRGREVEV